MTRQTLLELEGEYAIRLKDMPPHARGIVIYDDDGFANVYINSRLTAAQQRDAADHELDHIAHDDINTDEDIRAVETRASGLKSRLPASILPYLKRASDLLPPRPIPSPPGPQEPYCWLNRYQFVEAELAPFEDRWLEPEY